MLESASQVVSTDPSDPIESTHPDPDHGSQVGPPRSASTPSLRDVLATALASGTVCRTCVS